MFVRKKIPATISRAGSFWRMEINYLRMSRNWAAVTKNVFLHQGSWCLLAASISISCNFTARFHAPPKIGTVYILFFQARNCAEHKKATIPNIHALLHGIFKAQSLGKKISV